jgi:hypothetical protein
LLKLFHPDCRTIEQLRQLQPASCNDPIPDQILLTLAGIHILQHFYEEKKNCWQLVANKAIAATIKEFKQHGKCVTKEEVQRMIDEVVVNFSINPESYTA